MNPIYLENKKWILACDSGGSKTVLRLLDTEGNTLSRGRCGGVASLKAGMLPVEEELRKGIASLDRKITPDNVQLIYLSLGGPNTEEVYHILTTCLTGNIKTVVEREASGDMMLAAGSCYSCSGAILVGTGSVAVGVRGGKRVFAGGWGPLLDDLGSGGNLGLSALKYFLLSVDGRKPRSEAIARIFSFLTEGVDPETFTGRMELKMRANALSRKDLASLAPEIFSGAEQGDPILCALIRESAHFIGEMACAVTDPEQKEKRILACGGLFQAGESFRKMCAESFRQKCPDGELIFAHGSTLCGFAAVRALTLCGITDSSIHNKQLEDF